MANHTHKPHLEKHQLFRGVNIDDLNLTNNRVLCKRITHNIDDGVGKIAYPKQFNQNQYLYQNVDRVYEVVRTPDTILPYRWGTVVEIKGGDWVWVKPTEALNSPEIIDADGVEYRLIRYTELIVAKRKKAVIPLNGNIIMSNIFANKFAVKGVELVMRPQIEYGLARIEYVGRPNDFYVSNESDEGIDVKCGDVVVVELANKNEVSQSRNYLEEEMFAVFDDKKKKYFYMQRRDILGILENVVDTK